MKNQQKGFIPILIIILAVATLMVGVGIAYYVAKQKVSSPQSPVAPQSSTTTATTSISTDETANWKTYRGEQSGVEFKYPLRLIEQPFHLTGSGFYQDFRDLENKFILSFSGRANYNQVTGKPYVNLDDYLAFPDDYRARPQKTRVLIGGQEGRQSAPVAGSENVYSIVFFSKDEKLIYTLALQTGDRQTDMTKADLEEGRKLFGQILSTFKFTEPISRVVSSSKWKTYADPALGFSFEYLPGGGPASDNAAAKEGFFHLDGVTITYQAIGVLDPVEEWRRRWEGTGAAELLVGSLSVMRQGNAAYFEFMNSGKPRRITIEKQSAASEVDFKRLLSSVQIFERPPSPVAQKIYRNEVYGFSVYYPAEKLVSSKDAVFSPRVKGSLVEFIPK